MKRRAFIIGRNGPRSLQLDTLRFAEADALRMEKALAGPVAAFDEVVTASQNLGASDCLSHFEQLSARCSYDDVLVFYFSGHGHNPRGDLFLLFPDTGLDRLVTTALPISSVKSVMAQSKAMVRLLILDCCHSGAAAPETMKTGSRPQELALVGAARDSASIIIAACGRNVVTREQDEFGGGYLTYLLSRSLSESMADSDIDRDGLISVTDFIDWASTETARINLLNSKDGRPTLEPPEIYGDFRSQVYLTASRFVVRDEELQLEVLQQVEMIRAEFAKKKFVEPVRLQALARPIKGVAPTLTNLNVLDELFRSRDDAAIFAAATILQIRRDPRYMSILLSYVDDDSLRGASNWRVLRAVRDTISRYEFTDAGREDFIVRLRRAAVQRDTKRGAKFAKGTSLGLIRQIAKRLKIRPEDIFTSTQLNESN